MASQTTAVKKCSVTARLVGDRLFPLMIVDHHYVESYGLSKTSSGIVRLNHLIGGRLTLEKVIVKGKAKAFVTLLDGYAQNPPVLSTQIGDEKPEGTVVHYIHLLIDFPLAVGFSSGVSSVHFQLKAPNGHEYEIRVV